MHLESFSVVQLVSPVATEEPQSERERNRRKSKPVPSRVTALMMMMTTAEPCATSRLVSSILVARAEQQLSNDPSSIYQLHRDRFPKVRSFTWGHPVRRPHTKRHPVATSRALARLSTRCSTRRLRNFLRQPYSIRSRFGN